MAEIFLHNIPFFTTAHDVTRTLADHLHDPSNAFSGSGAPINFNLRLFKKHRGRGNQHKGSGALTLPTEDIGRKFLELYGGPRPRKQIVSSSRRLIFQISKFPPSPDVVLHVQSEPYLDPAVLEAREKISGQVDDGSVSVRSLQFGWDCRDYVFGIEWEYHCPDGTALKFDHENRRLFVQIKHGRTPTSASAATSSMFDSDFLGEFLSSSTTSFISIHYSQIDYISANHTSEPAIFLSLTTPPSFEESSGSVLSGFIADNRTASAKKKRAFLPFGDTAGRRHADVAPFTSLSLRLVCRETRDLQEFQRLAEVTQIGVSVNNSFYPTEHRGLFSSNALRDFHAWIRTLAFPIAFQVQGLLHSCSADPTELLQLRPNIARLQQTANSNGARGMERAVLILRDFGALARELFWDSGNERTLLHCFQDVQRTYSRDDAPVISQRLDDGLFLCLHVIITPTGMAFEGPIPERSNRVIRSFEASNHGNFIRVSFMDEGKMGIQYARDVDVRDFVRHRVGPFLKDGLDIAGRRFTFLGYSQSALKEHSVYFVTPFMDSGRSVDAASIIRGLGTFDGLPTDSRLMYCPARFGARISMAFTATDPSTVVVEHIKEIADIESIDAHGKRWTHTDGVGTMSPQFARQIHVERQSQGRGRRRPSYEYARALQIRFMGSKGMLSVDHTLTGSTVCLRPSMIKFTGTQSNKIEIAKVFDKPGPFFLNRPLIMLLEGLGVPYATFETYQDLAVMDARESVESLERSGHFLEGYGLGVSFRIHSVLLSLAKLPGLSRVSDNNFLNTVMRFGINHVLRFLKHRARIPVPGAYNLVGIADVHRYLQPGEVFVCIKPPDNSGIKYLEGDVLVSRSPTIHPGDVQIVRAIGTPPSGSCFAEEPLANTLVFSTTDNRPMPSCLGGGDLDGDEYNVIPLEELDEFRPTRIVDASQYPSAARKELDRHCNMQDVADFVMDYVTSDVLGYVSINWRLRADQTTIFDADCMKLADLHSLAVDYPKSGNPVPISTIPKRTNQLLPDWYAPETMSELNTEKYYRSQKAIGKLYRRIELDGAETGRQPSREQHGSREGGRRRRRQNRDELDELTEQMHQSLLTNEETQDHISRAVIARVREFVNVEQLLDSLPDLVSMFKQYCSTLKSICMTHTLSYTRGSMLSEEEAVVGTIVANSSQPRKRLDHIRKLREETEVLVREVRLSLAGDEGTSAQASLQRSFYAWRLVGPRNRSTFGSQSFAWITLGAVFEAIREIEAEQERARWRNPNRAARGGMARTH